MAMNWNLPTIIRLWTSKSEINAPYRAPRIHPWNTTNSDYRPYETPNDTVQEDFWMGDQQNDKTQFKLW